MKLQFKKLDDRAVAPKYGSIQSAGADLCAVLDEPVTIAPGETVFIHTGLAVAIPDGYVGLVYARSGIACKRGLAPANKTGVVDADYRGEIMVALHNHGAVCQTIEPNERIAQMVVTPFLHCDFEETDNLDDTARGSGGFGSTGRNTIITKPVGVVAPLEQKLKSAAWLNQHGFKTTIYGGQAPQREDV